MPFTLGQRWIGDAESELGLGTVVAVDARTVTYFSHLLVKTVCTHAVIARDPRDVQPW